MKTFSIIAFWFTQDIKFFSKIPPKAVFSSMISACTVIMILSIPTIVLNGVSVVTIMKCSQLKKKIAYFIIMIQSLADLVVGCVSLPLMSYVCITDAFGIGDCFTQAVDSKCHDPSSFNISDNLNRHDS